MRRERCKRHIAASNRKAERYAAHGRDNEEKVRQFLADCKNDQEEPIFSRVTRHQPNTYADHHGRDFTVVCGGVERSFGISISADSWRASRLKHPDVPQFEVPIGFNQERLLKKILALFNE